MYHITIAFDPNVSYQIHNCVSWLRMLDIHRDFSIVKTLEVWRSLVSGSTIEYDTFWCPPTDDVPAGLKVTITNESKPVQNDYVSNTKLIENGANGDTEAAILVCKMLLAGKISYGVPCG